MPDIKKRRASTGWIIILKFVILVAVVALVYGKISNPHNFGNQFIITLKEIASNSVAIALLIIVVLLMPVNWLFEANKWQVLCEALVSITLKSAFVGVLSGLSMGFATPHGIGDYAGRIWQVNIGERGRLVGGVWLGKVSQMMITALFGTFGVWVYVSQNNAVSFDFALFTKIGLAMVILGLLILTLVLLTGLKTKIMNWVRYYFGIVLTYPMSSIIKVILFSLLRYITFTTQFVLVMFAVGVDMPVLKQIAGIGWIFLMKSIIPSFNFLSDLGIREYSALTFFDNYAVDQAAIIAASLIVWVINILLPVLIGLVFMFKTKSKS